MIFYFWIKNRRLVQLNPNLLTQDFINLLVWKKSITFISDTYKQTAIFLWEERYSPTSQTRPAAAIFNNIAEAFGKYTRNGSVNFLQTSPDFSREVENCQLIFRDLLYLNEKDSNIPHQSDS